MNKPEFMSEPLQEIVYCVAKRGEYSLEDEYKKARLISECNSFEEFRDISTVFSLSRDGQIDDDVLDSFARLRGYDIPKLDRMLRWPWDERYENE